jgi:hypothetical protein
MIPKKNISDWIIEISCKARKGSINKKGLLVAISPKPWVTKAWKSDKMIMRMIGEKSIPPNLRGKIRLQ